jgi:iron complex outermembrane receptor protein
VYYFKESGDGFSDNFDSNTQAQTSHLPATRTTPLRRVRFGDLRLSDSVVRGGLRYTHDKKDFRTVEAST